MAFDFTKEYKEFYLPPSKPGILEIPTMNFLAVRGQGDPNKEDGEYAKGVGLLYGVLYTIKMSYKGTHRIDGFFEFKAPPLEGFWWQEGIKGMDYSRKENFSFISVIRLPGFVQREDYMWALDEAARKKKDDFSAVEYFTYTEGLCVQCMHAGPYDDEPATVAAMAAYVTEQGYTIDITAQRHHHEIYLKDPRKTKPENLRTVIRHPIRL